MNHQYSNSKLAAAINGMSSSSISSSNIIQQQQPVQQQQQQQQTTTDAVIVQSNSSVVSDEFLMQLQEQFGGENKQIYILNNNQNSNSTNQNQANNDSQNTIQYLIVDKDVDINVILQDPNIFNQTNMSINQQQPQQQIQQNQPQQQQYTNSVNNNNHISNLNDLSSVQIQQQQQQQQLPQQQSTHQQVNKPTYLAKQQFINQNNSVPIRYGNTNNINQVNSVHKNASSGSNSNINGSLIQNNNLINNQSNQMIVEESIQRVQVPPPKRKQFEFKLENKRNSYQDVFLRFLAGEKQPTLEIISEHTSKKPKDNIYYPNTAQNSNQANAAQKTNTTTNQSQSKITISSSVVNNTPTQSSSSIHITPNNQTTGATNVTATIDKENYYNSSRRENLLPLNNYEYRNSYKDHYDNQGVRVNPAVLKNLSYTTPQQAAGSQQILNNISDLGMIPQTIDNNRSINHNNGKNISSPSPNRSTLDNIDVGTSSNQINKNGKSTITKLNGQINSENANELNQIFGYANNLIDNSNSIPGNNNDSLNKTDIDDVSNIVSGLEDVVNSIENNNNKSNNLNTIPENKNVDQTQSSTDNSVKITDPINNIQNNSQKLPDTFNNDLSNNTPQNIKDTSQININNNMTIQQKSQMMPQRVEPNEEVTFTSGEFLIHKSTFSGDFDNYDIWCVLDDGYLQKYEPVLLASGERCHQSADVLARYTPDKAEFVFVKVDEKGKTEQNNIVVGVLSEYEPKNRKIFINQQIVSPIIEQTSEPTAINEELQRSTNETAASSIAQSGSNQQQALNNSSSSNNNVVVVTYDDLKTTLDVFLQVLLSQHLNGEFLLRIKELQDEYFKPSIEFIDTILNEKYTLLLNSFSHFMNLKKTDSVTSPQNSYSLDQLFKYQFETKPKLISQQATTQQPSKCQAIETLDDIANDTSLIACYLVKFSGQSYNADTLMPITDYAANMLNEQMEKDGINKEFFICKKTLQFAQLCHSLKHLKMHFYEICQQKIETVKAQINESDTNTSGTAASDILNYCLADNQWLLEMFEKFKQLLFDVDSLLSDDQQTEQGQSTIQPTENQAIIENTHTQTQQQDQSAQQIHLPGETILGGDSSNSNATQHGSADFQVSSDNGPQSIGEHSNSVGSVETNRLINDQISQIISDVEQINEMETS